MYMVYVLLAWETFIIAPAQAPAQLISEIAPQAAHASPAAAQAHQHTTMPMPALGNWMLARRLVIGCLPAALLTRKCGRQMNKRHLRPSCRHLKKKLPWIQRLLDAYAG